VRSLSEKPLHVGSNVRFTWRIWLCVINCRRMLSGSDRSELATRLTLLLISCDSMSGWLAKCAVQPAFRDCAMCLVFLSDRGTERTKAALWSLEWVGYHVNTRVPVVSEDTYTGPR